MRIGVIGLGSMGKRRVRDIVALGHEVIGIDPREDRRQEAKRLHNIETAAEAEILVGEVDGAVISTPPDRHAFFYNYCYENDLSFFSEANILTPSPKWFDQWHDRTRARGYPSGTWLFHPLVQRLKEKVEAIGADRVNTVTHQYGGFLPDWHSWEPYHAFYAGRKNTSATREMVPFEVEILVSIFGRVKHVSAVKRQTRPWHNPIDDSCLLLLQFESGVVGTLTIELHQVAPFRTTRIALQDDALLLSLGDGRLEHYARETGTWSRETPQSYRGRYGFYFEDIYSQEIRTYLEALAGKPYPKTWEEDRHLSDILFAAELSSREGREIAIADIANSYDGFSWIGDDGLRLAPEG